MPDPGDLRSPYRLLAPLSLVAVAIAFCAVVTLSEVGGSDPATADDRAPVRNAAGRDRDRDRGRDRDRDRDRPGTVTVGWVGDTVLGSRHGIPPDGGRALLSEVRPLLRRPDVMIGNLEGVIGTRGAAKCPLGTPNCFAFQAPPVAARTLAWAGFDVLNLANNHANDYGAVGLADTRRHLETAGLAHTGAPGQVTVVRRAGISVAVVGFSSYPWAARLEDIASAVRQVARAREAADVVVVVMHAGAEGADQVRTPMGREIAYGEDRGDTRAFAHAAVDAGADAVFGSGPHVVRGVERRRGAPIVYSTGNFAGFHTFPTAGVLGLSGLVSVTLDDRGRLRRGRWTPIRLAPPGRPAVDPAGTSTAMAAGLSQADFASPGLTPDGRLVLPPR